MQRCQCQKQQQAEGAATAAAAARTSRRWRRTCARGDTADGDDQVRRIVGIVRIEVIAGDGGV